MSDNRKNVQAVIDGILAGKILETFDAYYDDNVVMTENRTDPRVGKAANRKHEEYFVNNFDFHGAKVGAVVVDGDHAAVEWWMKLSQKGSKDTMERWQVAMQTWKNGKIVQENFYYNG